MDTIEVRTTVERPREVVFPFLLDFGGYAAYSRYLREVAVNGDGGVDTTYRLRFGWWKLTYDAHARVTGVEEPRLIEWEIVRDIDAHGRWVVEELDDGARSLVTFVVTYDPASVSPGDLDVPRFVSLEWVVSKAIGLIEAEGRRVVRRVVTDLEGESRPVDLEVRHR